MKSKITTIALISAGILLGIVLIFGVFFPVGFYHFGIALAILSIFPIFLIVFSFTMQDESKERIKELEEENAFLKKNNENHERLFSECKELLESYNENTEKYEECTIFHDTDVYKDFIKLSAELSDFFYIMNNRYIDYSKFLLSHLKYLKFVNIIYESENYELGFVYPNGIEVTVETCIEENKPIYWKVSGVKGERLITEAPFSKDAKIFKTSNGVEKFLYNVQNM